MTQEELIIYWKNFFKDLFLGTFSRAVLWCSLSILLSIGLFSLFKAFILDSINIGMWIEWLFLGLAAFWYFSWGVFHGLSGAIIHTIHKKISETIGGLQGLLDLLSKQVFMSTSKVQRVFTKEEISEKFNSFGNKFLNELKLKSPAGWAASFFFKLILKVLRLMFLDDVTKTLLQKPGHQILPSDIESAVRRVSIDAMLTPIIEQFMLVHFLNFALMVVSFGLPFILLLII
tara:strand:- start:344 stop:1036 length:693 start_codon:yes stop_codon:yes gene_type:complete